MLLGIVVDNRGLVPDADVKRLNEFGSAIRNRFSNAIGESHGKGNEFVITFAHPQKVNCAIISEDISHGERVRKYILEGEQNHQWIKISEGQSIGHKRIENFPADTFSGIRLVIVGHAGKPIIKTFRCYHSN
jgi:alpha-L-fucosidase